MELKEKLKDIRLKEVMPLVESLHQRNSDGYRYAKDHKREDMVQIMLLQEILDELKKLNSNKNKVEEVSESVTTERDLLKKELDEKQIKYHHNASVETLKKLLEKK